MVDTDEERVAEAAFELRVKELALRDVSEVRVVADVVFELREAVAALDVRDAEAAFDVREVDAALERTAAVFWLP